jgi:hypothetical protein
MIITMASYTAGNCDVVWERSWQKIRIWQRPRE